jgi:hypothetical protein
LADKLPIHEIASDASSLISRMSKGSEKEPRPYHLLLQISRIDNLACCPVLRQLTITGNKISSADDVSQLKASLHRFSN